MNLFVDGMLACTQTLSTDARPEVRNCAARTLFLVVASQGARLSAAAWEEVVWQLVFPLLRAVHHMAATSSREEVSQQPLSKVRIFEKGRFCMEICMKTILEGSWTAHMPKLAW